MGFFLALVRRLVDAMLRAGAPRAKRSVGVVLLGVLAITTWQVQLSSAPEKLDAKYKITASHGAHSEKAFFFFRYHLGLYPVASEIKPNKDTKNEAERLLRAAAPDKLYQEEGLTFRSGDHGRIHLFYVDKWLGGDARDPSLRPANRLAFIVALDALFISAWFVDWTLLGALLVLFFGSNPVQLYAAYAEENYFSWPITTFLLVLALNLPLIVERPPRRKWIFIAPVLTALLLAVVRTWRSEPATLVASAILAYALARGFSWRARAIAVALVLVTFVAANKSYQIAIRSKVEHTKAVLRDTGTPTYDGPTIFHHELWHPVWCGLGDFDTKHGYVWEDRQAYAYALPILEARAGRKLPLDTNQWFQAEELGGPRYHAIFSDTPGYHDIVRDKVLSDIRRDPLWYMGIIAKRVRRVLDEATPIEIALGSDHKAQGTASLFGWIALPLAFVLLRVRRGFFTKLLLFPLPLSIPAIMVYSGGGLNLYSSFHVVSAAIVVLLVLQGVGARLRHDQRRTEEPAS